MQCALITRTYVMDIIAHEQTEKQPRALSPDAGVPGEYQEWRADVYQALLDAGLEHEAELFWSCAGDSPTYFIAKNKTIPADAPEKCVICCASDPGHHAKAIKATCELRICPECARRLTNRFMARYVPLFECLVRDGRRDYRLRKITLTTPCSLEADDVEEQYRFYRQAVVRLFDDLLSEGWRKRQAVLVADEFGPKGRKLHFHILHFGEWIENRAGYDNTLADAWRAVTNDQAEVVYIELVDKADVKKAVIESVKYATKMWKVDDETGDVVRIEPGLVPLLLQVFKGQRRVRSYGLAYAIGPVEPAPDRCPVCNALMVKYTVGEWNIYVQTGWTIEEVSQYLSADIANKSDTRAPPKRSQNSGLEGLRQPFLPGDVGSAANSLILHV